VQARECVHFALGQRLPGDDEHVGVAGLGVEASERQRAAHVDAGQVRAEGPAEAAEQGVEEGSGVGWETVPAGVCHGH
jgi:hypothetical protein